jgi:hypothetical protein
MSGPTASCAGPQPHRCSPVTHPGCRVGSRSRGRWGRLRPGGVRRLRVRRGPGRRGCGTACDGLPQSDGQRGAQASGNQEVGRLCPAVRSEGQGADRTVDSSHGGPIAAGLAPGRTGAVCEWLSEQSGAFRKDRDRGNRRVRGVMDGQMVTEVRQRCSSNSGSQLRSHGGWPTVTTAIDGNLRLVAGSDGSSF